MSDSVGAGEGRRSVLVCSPQIQPSDCPTAHGGGALWMIHLGVSDGVQGFQTLEMLISVSSYDERIESFFFSLTAA